MSVLFEQWRDVPGYEGIYQVSSQGRVKSLGRTVRASHGGQKPIREHIMDTWDRGGYISVGLNDNGVQRFAFVHRLLLRAFVGECPPGMEGCHSDGNPRNNALTNLRWDTHRSNIQDSVRLGTNRSMRRTECPQGHPYNDVNTGVTPQGYRRCRRCHREREAARRLKETA